MNQRGFVLMTYAYIAAGVVVLGMAGAVYVQTLRLTACKAEYSKFVGGVEALGKAAEKAAKDKEAMDRIFKETTDAKHARTTADLRATVKRLRDERTRSGSLPAAPAGSRDPSLACFDRAELGGAVGNLEAGMEGLVAEGAEAAVGLDSARTWAKSLSLP